MAFCKDVVYVVRTNPGTSSGSEREGPCIPYNKPHGSGFDCGSSATVVGPYKKLDCSAFSAAFALCPLELPQRKRVKLHLKFL